MFARILPKVGCDSSACGYSTLIDFGMSEPAHLTSRFRCRRWSVKDITRRRRASGVGALCVSPLGPWVAARRRSVVASHFPATIFRAHEKRDEVTHVTPLGPPLVTQRGQMWVV